MTREGDRGFESPKAVNQENPDILGIAEAKHRHFLGTAVLMLKGVGEAEAHFMTSNSYEAERMLPIFFGSMWVNVSKENDGNGQNRK